MEFGHRYGWWCVRGRGGERAVGGAGLHRSFELAARSSVLTVKPDEVLDGAQADVRLKGGCDDEGADQDQRHAVARVVGGVQKERAEPDDDDEDGDGELLHEEDEEVAPNVDDDLASVRWMHPKRARGRARGMGSDELRHGGRWV